MTPELRDFPRCPVCRWRHNGVCEKDDSPIKALGETINGKILWAVGPSVPTRRGGRNLGHRRPDTTGGSR